MVGGMTRRTTHEHAPEQEKEIASIFFHLFIYIYMEYKEQYLVIDDLVLQLKYEQGAYSMGSVPDRPQIYIANLHHGHSNQKRYWGITIKKSGKFQSKSESGMGIKLLAWSVKNIKKLFPDPLPNPEYWSGNFGPGLGYWSKTTLWEKLERETYISAENMNQWAEQELTPEDEKSINKKIKIHDSDKFLEGGKMKKKKRTTRRIKKRKRSTKKRRTKKRKGTRQRAV